MSAPIAAMLVGIAMGGLIQRVGASNPAIIAKNLRLENLSIIKFMATTIAIGMILSYAMNAVIPAHFDIKPTYVVGVLVGGLIFGVGFAVGGFCPGTCIVGVGEGRKDAWFALLGGMLGAFVFTAAYRFLLEPLIKPMDFGKITLPGVLHLPVLPTALAVAAIFLVVVYLLPDNPGAQAADA